MTLRGSAVFAVLLIGLMSLVQIQYGLAVVAEVWDSILSWDNPATQAFEDSAALTPPCIDPARQARDRIAALARHASGRVLLVEEPSSVQSATCPPQIIRPPPTA